MTRIIAGFAGSLTLAVPRSGTRPTSDRVREAIFSALEARDAIDGARCSTSTPDRARSASRRPRAARPRSCSSRRRSRRPRSAAATPTRSPGPRGAAPTARPRGDARGRVVPRVRASARSTSCSSTRPTTSTKPRSRDDLALLAPLLAADAVVVVERSSRSPEPRWPAGIVPERRRDYGETTLWWASAQPARPSQPE